MACIFKGTGLSAATRKSMQKLLLFLFINSWDLPLDVEHVTHHMVKFYTGKEQFYKKCC